jgi:transposase
MNRGDLTNRQWERLAPLLPPQKPKTGRPAHDHRPIINGILWILRTGAPWRDLPACYGPWQTVASRFYRWRKAGIWQQILEALQQQADATGALEWTIHYVDATVIRAHQHAAGAAGSDAETEALGRSQGGFSTKVHVRAEGGGKPMTIVITPGQRHETVAFEPLMEQGAVRRPRGGRPRLRPGRVVGDKSYSSRKIRGYLRQRGVRVTIPRRSTERRTGRFDQQVYRLRNRVERLINRLKQFRRVATRYEKLAANYQAMVTLAASLLWL